MLGKVVVDEQRVLSFVHEVLAHRATGIGRDVPQRGGLASGGRNDDRVLHRAPRLERGGDLRHGGCPLPDGDVDADDALALLVDDGVQRNCGLARLPVANDQLALAASDGNHGVDGLDPGLERRVDRLARDHPGCHLLDRRELFGFDRALAVDRFAERVHHPADERIAHRHLDDLAGGPDLVAFFDALIGPEDDRADRILLEVERDAADPALEFEQLEGLCTLQAVDLRDPVADLGNDAHVRGQDRDVELLDPALDQAADFVGTDAHMISPSYPVSRWRSRSSWVRTLPSMRWSPIWMVAPATNSGSCQYSIRTFLPTRSASDRSSRMPSSA